ncbi:MAG TPA: hypothetical protein PK325_00945 [Cyclobacteriaceae bacterium]|nr:hypothetical protein [Cyclobacteriaceae bacterium]HMV08164.1 hypothetical protein [Cyclobacteriaceae bacterium]HMX00805.1 hypothetical protein [Cyclobacteriaceae bacterium]HMX49320.1 hypothetical protein [Cyclobacteriaceae bacterium]HMY93608.1 hypothetical protein [Cyclobacteriaceae bacterium]
MMTVSINNRLINFAQQELVIKNDSPERERIKGSLEQLEKILKDQFRGELQEVKRFGSFTRNTILPRKYDTHADVDLMVVFKTDSTRYTPGTYRERLLRVLNGAYPNSISKKDFPAVKLELNHIMFDVVPAYQESYSWDTSLYIPGAADSWRTTVPNDINDSLTKMNQSYGDNIVRQVIRLCKHWNFGAGYPFESYLMEKKIVEMFFWWGDNLYEKFMSVLSNLAGDRAGVRQALEYLQQYERQGNVAKQAEWLQRLLPGFNG